MADYSALEWLQSTVTEHFKSKLIPCNRSLRIYGESQEVVGETPPGSIVWKWNAAQLRKLQVRTEGIGNEHLLDPTDATQNADMDF